MEWYHFVEQGNCAFQRKIVADARFARFLDSTWKYIESLTSLCAWLDQEKLARFL